MELMQCKASSNVVVYQAFCVAVLPGTRLTPSVPLCCSLGGARASPAWVTLGLSAFLSQPLCSRKSTAEGQSLQGDSASRGTVPAEGQSQPSVAPAEGHGCTACLQCCSIPSAVLSTKLRAGLPPAALLGTAPGSAPSGLLPHRSTSACLPPSATTDSVHAILSNLE